MDKDKNDSIHPENDGVSKEKTKKDRAKDVSDPETSNKVRIEDEIAIRTAKKKKKYSRVHYKSEPVDLKK